MKRRITQAARRFCQDFKLFSASLALLTLSATSFAFDGAMMMGGEARPGAPLHQIDYAFAAAPSFREHTGSAKFSLLNGAQDKVAILARGGTLKLEEGPMANRRLWSPDLGLSYSHNYSERHKWGVFSSVGSASDDPFASSDEIKASITLFYQTEAGATDSWMFFLNYANKRGFLQNIPLPGFGYLLSSEDKKFVAMLGVPFFMFWSPVDKWFFRTGLLIPALVSAEISTIEFMPVTLKAGFEWKFQDYLLAERSNSKEQFFYDHKSVYLAARMPIVKGIAAELTGMYLWDRRTFLAEGFFERNKIGLRRLNRGLAAKAALTASF